MIGTKIFASLALVGAVLAQELSITTPVSIWACERPDGCGSQRH